MPPETLGAALRDGRRRLEEAGIESASLDARLLLQHAADVSHEELIADSSRLANPEAMAAYRSMLQRRSTREPVSRITGQREFYGRRFAVTPAVLDPRPDTETLIEAALAILPAGIAPTILDLGTGSGAIIVTLLAERPQARGTATDLSATVLEAAKANAARHGVGSRLELIESDWWQGVSGRFDVIVSNPPYIPKAAIAGLAPEVRDFEPWAALDGGPDGYEAYRRIAEGGLAHLSPNGRVLVEIGDRQGHDVAAMFEENGLAPSRQWRDLGGRIRCLGFTAA